MNRWLQGLVVAIGFLLVLFPQALLAQGIGDPVKERAKVLKEELKGVDNPEDVATQFHHGVLGEVEGLVRDKVADDSKAVENIQRASEVSAPSSALRWGSGSHRRYQRSTPGRGSFRGGGFGGPRGGSRPRQ